MAIVYIIQKDYYINENGLLCDSMQEATSFHHIWEIPIFLEQNKFDIETCIVEYDMTYKVLQRFFVENDNTMSNNIDEALLFDNYVEASMYMLQHKLSSYKIVPMIL